MNDLNIMHKIGDDGDNRNTMEDTYSDDYEKNPRYLQPHREFVIFGTKQVKEFCSNHV